MTHVYSVVPAVDALVFHPLPSRRPVSGRVCRVEGAVVVLTDAGRIYSSEVQNRVVYLRGSAKFERTFAALVKLGVVTKAEADAHLADIAAIRKADSDKWEAKRMLDGAKALGIKLTVAQRGQTRARPFTLRAASGPHTAGRVTSRTNTAGHPSVSPATAPEPRPPTVPAWLRKAAND